MHLGFSYVGLFFLIMLFVPNLLWTRHKPRDYDKYAQKENRFLLALERIGEVAVYGANPFLLAAGIVLGIGHIGIHLQHRREACNID